MNTVGKLVVLSGPTGVGKTQLSLALARKWSVPIISADSRQIYREIPIGTAAPTPQEQALCTHYMVGVKSVTELYSAGMYEVEVMQLLESLFLSHDTLLLVGGSMLYLDAICKGVNDIPDADLQIREWLNQRADNEGLDGILAELKLVDPDYYRKVDKKNRQRVIHGLEIFLSCGKPLSSFYVKQIKKRPFSIHKFALIREREDLYRRIDQRVLAMIEQGLLQEAQSLYEHRHLNALNTVGYKELFSYFDGTIDRAEAIRLIQRNTRHLARKQLSWMRRDGDYHYLDAALPVDSLLQQIEHIIAS